MLWSALLSAGPWLATAQAFTLDVVWKTTDDVDAFILNRLQRGAAKGLRTESVAETPVNFDQVNTSGGFYGARADGIRDSGLPISLSELHLAWNL